MPERPAAPTPPRTAADMVRMAREFLERKGVETARLEAELLVAQALGLSRLEVFLQLDRPLDEREIDTARELLVRRGRREPLAYITGAREFYGRSFRVGPGVLIPRPETELLVDRAHERVRKRATRGRVRITDLGTGSGCIAITLALEIPEADVFAVEASPAALAFARANAAALGVRVEFREGDAFVAMAQLARESGVFDLIVCNPPYVRPEDANTLAPEVRDREPEVALFTPPGDPDRWLIRLADAARDHLAPGGALLVELGADQAARAVSIAEARGLVARTHRDLAGIERVLEAERA